MSNQSYFLHFPNELVYHCFNYLSFDDILQSFGDLNARLTHLITNYWTSIQIDNDLRQSQFKRLLNHLNPKQVRYLDLSRENDDRSYIQEFLSSFSIEQFENLQFLKLNNLSQQSFHSILSHLHQLQHLNKLIILDYADDADDDQFIFEQLFSKPIPTLKSMRLDFILHYHPPTITSNLDNYSLFNVEILSLCCYIDHVHYFLERTPLLKKLTLSLYETYESNTQLLDINKYRFFNIPSTLSYLQINFTGATNFYKMNMVTELFKINCSSLSQLQHLVLIGEVHETFLNGQRWEQIIESYLLSLECFQFKFEVTDDNNWNYIEYHHGQWIPVGFEDIMNTFKSDFWLNKHRWFVYGETDDETTVLYTLPYCESSSLYLKTTLPNNENYRVQITNPILPYKHQYRQTMQELTLCFNSNGDSFDRFYRYYFSNVIKLCLNTETVVQNIIELLRNILNLNNVQQLELTQPIRLNSDGISNLLSHLPNLTTLYIWYRITKDFTFLTSISNKSLLKHLEIRVSTIEDFQTILGILQNNFCSLLFKVCIEEAKSIENIREFLSNWLNEQVRFQHFHILNMKGVDSWMTIEYANDID